MALIVETGTGAIDSESYVSVAEADTYHDNRANTNWALLTTLEKEEALRRATDYLEQVYSLVFKGSRIYSTQALSFPRRDVEVHGFYIDSNIIPIYLKSATCSLAFRAAQGELALDISQAVKREKIDVLEVEYMENSSPIVKYREIDNILAPLLRNLPSGAMRHLVRA